VVGIASCVFFCCFLLLIERGSGRPYAFSVGLLITAGHQNSIAFFITHTHTHVIVSKHKQIYCNGFRLTILIQEVKWCVIYQLYVCGWFMWV